MKSLVLLGVLLICGAEGLALLLRQRQLLLTASGIAVAFLLLGILRLLGARDTEPAPGQQDSDAGGDSLRHWISGTATRIHWSESTRTDWDRHWRPVLARRFEIATGQRQEKDRAAFDAAGQLLFGARLWAWVDPGNVARTGGQQPGPGRAALEEILQRLEQR
ncbi:MAG TPA: hypothetical protein VFR27_15845 [Mycobacterium sp.]|nr:hypothetical protein [Mycobacterium sp.]